MSDITPSQLRERIRAGNFNSPTTAGFCGGNLQTNVLILPKSLAQDFRLLCLRNPVSCPLIAESRTPGDPTFGDTVAKSGDIRTDCPGYNVYERGKLVQKNVRDILDLWDPDDSVAFLIGCSYTFEDELQKNGLTPRHIELGRNCPMYKTKIPLCPSGAFSGHMVVSMRPYPISELSRVRDITRPYVRSHGEPVAWGPEGARELGIDDPDGTHPDFGEASEIRDGEIAVYWGCGVTPQLVVMDSGIDGMAIGHAPGQMFVTDMQVKDACL